MRAPTVPSWRSTLALLALATSASLGGCAGDSPGEAEGSAETGDEQDIVDIFQTKVKNQSIGNCWAYASIGWAESLNYRATGQQLNLSESYLTYWDWYEKLVKDTTSEKISTGGWFNVATKLFDKYGLIDEGAFIEGEADVDRSAAQASAEASINAAIQSGKLKKDRSPKTIRDELNKAFGLSPKVVAALNATFGEGAPKSLASGAKPAAGFPLRRASELKATVKRAAQSTPSVGVLSDLFGSWQEVPVPSSSSSRRGLLRRVQKALHDGQPVLVIWDVDWESRDKLAGTFPAMKAGAKIDGRHMTLLEDYQAAFVPNAGTLPAGVLVSDPKVLTSALADQTEIQFLRIKNSWGATADPSGTGSFKGYADLYMDYLLPKGTSAPNGLVSFVLPSDYTSTPPSGVVDGCSKVGVDGSFCASSLLGDAKDGRLLTCQGKRTAKASACDGGCQKGTSGASDACSGKAEPPNPCINAELGPGKYCGTNLGLLPGEAGYDTLYSCQKDSSGAWISPGQACSKGCDARPAGEPDRCK